MTIKLLTIECKDVACIRPATDAAGLHYLKVSLEDVPTFELMTAIMAKLGHKVVLDHIAAHDIELYQKGVCNG